MSTHPEKLPEKLPAGASVHSDPTPQVAGPIKVKKYLTVIVLAIFAALLGRNFWIESADTEKNKTSLVKPAFDAGISAPKLDLQLTLTDYAASLPVLPVNPLPPHRLHHSMCR